VDGVGGYTAAHANELVERDHELRAALYGIEAVAGALHEHRDRLPSGDIDQLALAIASEARRMQLMLEPRAKQRTTFDLADAILPAIIMTSALGVVVHNTVPTGTWVDGCRDDTAQVVLALLDNARVHAGTSAVDVRARVSVGVTRLYIEDRGLGLKGAGGQSMFERGRLGTQSSGSGLGLYIARRLMVEQSGSLTVARRAGGGASFVLSLPTSRSRTSARLPRPALQPAAVR
jgi:signal transduction histidine kinase